jgi:hypothetical protein
MRYMLLIYGDESAQAAASPDEQNAVYHPYADYTRWLTDKDVAHPKEAAVSS